MPFTRLAQDDPVATGAAAGGVSGSIPTVGVMPSLPMPQYLPHDRNLESGMTMEAWAQDLADKGRSLGRTPVAGRCGEVPV